MAGSKVRKIVDRWLRRSGRSYSSLESAASLLSIDLEELDHQQLRPQQQHKTKTKIVASRDDPENEDDDEEESRDPDSFVVYVGKDARRYVVDARHLKHPLFRSFVKRSSSLDEALVRISCEVVMFEHLLWMLESYDPAELQGDAINELLDMYSTG